MRGTCRGRVTSKVKEWGVSRSVLTALCSAALCSAVRRAGMALVGSQAVQPTAPALSRWEALISTACVREGTRACKRNQTGAADQPDFTRLAGLPLCG